MYRNLRRATETPAGTPVHPDQQAAVGMHLSSFCWIVTGTAAAVILTEIAMTRLFSVLLFYHYSFLAIALALFGLAAGGVSATRVPPEATPESVLARIRLTLVRASAGLIALIPVTVSAGAAEDPLPAALLLATASAVPLYFLGEALALALAQVKDNFSQLYALDLISSASAALASIPILTRVQGPLVLNVPALILLLVTLRLAPARHRGGALLASAVVAAVVCAAALQDGPLFFSAGRSSNILTERWNAHSRVILRDDGRDGRWIVIDRTAASLLPHTPPSAQGPAVNDSAWPTQFPDPAYALGRTVHSVAIIGLGGGPDILPALAAGATQVAGIELNGRILELLRGGARGYSTIARRPEVELIHDEARHALEHSQKRYDVLRANLIDTWAATAQGGFVLVENGIYTVEAWRLFLRRLTPSGILATTRWYLPAAPAEAQRLIALGAAALDGEGLGPATQRLIAITLPARSMDADPLAGGRLQTITTLISPTVFTMAEVASLESFVRRHGGAILLAPGRAGPATVDRWRALLSPGTRRAAIETSPWAIDPPTDERPYFFLQVRPGDVFKLGSGRTGMVSAITFNGMRVLLATVALAVLAAGLVWYGANRTLRAAEERLSTVGRGYFALAGLGYMAVQLGLLQRLSLVVGHPVTTLAMVLAAMLLGTGFGSAIAGHPRLRTSPWLLAAPVMAVAILTLLLGHVEVLQGVPSAIWVVVLTAATGMALGVVLPTGIHVFAQTRRSVAEAWAVNGAFSILGSAAAALGGLAIGSRGLFISAGLCYGSAILLFTSSRSRFLAQGGRQMVEP